MVENNYVFDFQKKIICCSQDVTILRLCNLEFREMFLRETSVDPFCYCTVTASVMAVYRSKYLEENTISLQKNILKKTCFVVRVNHILKSLYSV